MPVSKATLQDIPEVIELGSRMHAESVYSAVPLSREKFQRFLTFACQHPRHCVLIYRGAKRTIDGFYIGNISDYFFSDTLAAYDMVFYVAPERRGGIAAHRLYVAFREWARAQGAKHVWPGISAGIDVERASRFYRGMGLESVGSVFFGPL